MAFSVYITSSAKKSARHLPYKVRETIVRLCETSIAAHPFDHEKLTSPLDECRSFHFKISNVQYRIAYRIVKEENRIDIVLIGPRENFYDKLRRVLRK